MLAAGVVGAGALAQTANAGPPPGRAYERVSPADKPAGALAGLSSDLTALPGRAFADAEGLIYGASGTLDPNWSGPANTTIFGRRTATGWVAASASRSLDAGNTPLEIFAHDTRSAWVANDGRETVFGLSKPLDRISAGTFGGVFRASDDGAAPQLLSQPAGGITPVEGVLSQSVSAGDGTRVIAFVSSAPLTPDAPPAGTRAVYVYRNGALEIASRLPSGAVISAGEVNLANAGGQMTSGSPPAAKLRNQIADRGRFVLFISGGDATQGPLYVRDLEQNVTRQLSGPGTGAPGNAVQLYEGWGVGGSSMWLDVQTVPEGTAFAARDAPRAFLHTYSAVGVTGIAQEANLVDGTVTPRPAITGPPMGLSPDGTRMLFLAPPVNGDGGEAWTLRYWEASNPNVSVPIGTIPATNAEFGRGRSFGSSPDGKTWVFAVAGSLDPARPNGGPLTRQLYRWSVGDATPTCLSCLSTDGVARTSGANLWVQDSVSSEGFVAPTTALKNAGNLGKTNIAQSGHPMSDDGRWVLFDSPDRLVAADGNDVRDVYLWDRDAASGDRLQLLTSGAGNSPSWALDLAPDGRNAYFSTRDGLVPGDDDGAYDVYTARVGSGFPDSPESCVGEQCRPPVVQDPPHDLIASSVLTDSRAGGKQGVQQGSPVLRVRSVRTSPRRLTIRIDTPKAGRIRVSGVRVRTTSRTAKRATTYTVRVPLNVSTRRTVARGKAVKVSLRVQFTPTGSKKSSRVRTSVSVRKGQ